MAHAPPPDWRNADAGASESAESRSWKARASDTSGAPRPSSRFRRRAIVFTLVVGLAVTIGVLLSFLKGTRPACLILVGSGYEQNLLLPQNVCGWNGGLELLKHIDEDEESALAEWFRERFGQSSGIRRTQPVPLAEHTWKDTWREIAHRVSAGDEKEQVILYFSAHGYADEKDAYLLRDVADIKSADGFIGSRVPFSEVLASVKKDIPAEKAVVLILDVCHVQSHWPIGMLQNDFVERLQKKYTDEINAVENLTVICSTSPGQVSWPVEERHTNVFADFVSKGLHGEGKEPDESITVGGFFDYVKKNVNEWAKVNRAREQAPIRIGGANDPELLRVAKPVEKQAKKGIDLSAKEEPKKDAGEKGKEKKEEKKTEEPKKDDSAKARVIARFNPNELRPAWNNWLTLRRDYAPQVYAPHYWRLYQESLLRYEQLVRAGDPTKKADVLKKKLDLLESDIKNDKELDKALDCLGQSFPLARVLGYRPRTEYTQKELQTALAKWKTNVKVLQPFKNQADPERRYWQMHFSRMMLTAQLSEPAIDQKKLFTDLKNLSEELDVPLRAVEVQFVKMLGDADPALAKQPDLVQLAVRVRILAEEAALGAYGDGASSELYAETIFTRMQKQLEKTDAIRREGEDRLFGDPNTQAALAREKLTAALKGYAKIIADASQLRKALALRDEICAELPFFGASLATLPGVDNRSKAEIEAMRAKALSLGDGLAAVTRFVTKDDEPTPALKSIEADLKFVRENYRTLGETLRGLGADLQKNWHALDGVLRTPPSFATDVDVELRIALLTKLRDTAHNLDTGKFREPQTEQPEATVEIQRKLLRSALKTHADKIHTNEPRNVEDKVREFLLGQFSQALDKQIDPENETDLLTSVEHCRLILGYQADQMADQHRERINPAKRLRHLGSYNLLLGLARRTLDDHWFDPGAKDGVPYYVPVAQTYLAGAGKVLEPKDVKLIKARTELKERITASGLAISGDANRYWTSELSYPLQCAVKAQDGASAGLPTVWFEVPTGKPKTRETIRDWPPRLPAEVILSETEFAVQGKVPVTFHALYRGQHLTKEITVERPAPSVIVRHTAGPEKVGFAVRMDKVDYGAISIVLDNSGSMRTLHPKKGKEDRYAEPGETSRYDFAIKGLRQVLEKTLPEETFLSVSTFGGKVTEPQFVMPPNNPSEKPYQRWQKGRLNNLIADLETRSLNNFSPIANAITKSMEEGFPPRFENPKLVVVLTDGMDNYSFEKNAQTDPAARDRNTFQVAAALEKARKRHPDTEVVLVCFIDKDDAEYDQAKKQFLPIGADNIIFESDGAKLGKVIQDRIVRPYVRLKRNGKDARDFEGGREVNYKSDTALTWKPSLPRDDYIASVRDTSGTDTEVQMSPGHNLFSILKRIDNKFLFERGILGQQPEVEKNNILKDRKRDWLVTLLKNEKPFGAESRSQLITFEKTSELGKIRQFHPGFVWLEAAMADGAKVSQTVEWGSDLVVPAPTYSVDIANWPSGYPKLSAWFWPRPWDDMLGTVKPIIDKRFNIKDFKSHPDDLIESIRWENRPVGVITPKGRVEMKKDCLVIRSRYLDGQPVYIGLKEKSERLRVGSEHRFYERGGKCTAVFYDLPVALEEVDIVAIPVARFKEAAAQAGDRVEFAPTESIAVPNIFHKAIVDAVHGK